DEIAGRRRELEAHHDGEGAADEKEKCDPHQVQERDPLVIARQQPRFDAVAVVQVMPGRKEQGRRHFRTGVVSPAAGAVGGVWRAGGVSGWAPSDLMYSISCSSCSSVMRPWNEGMIGW